MPTTRSVVTIVRAVPEDAAAILALQRLAFTAEARRNHDFTIPALVETLDELSAEIAGGLVLKATLDGRIVGSVRGKADGATCHVSRTMVHPDFERRGIASQLLARIEASFPSATRFALVTGAASEGNIRFYERHGYRIHGTQVVSPVTSIVLMEKGAASEPGTETAPSVR